MVNIRMKGPLLHRFFHWCQCLRQGALGWVLHFAPLGSLGFLGVPWDHDGPWLQLRSPLVYGLTHECEDIADRAMIYLYNLYIYT